MIWCWVWHFHGWVPHLTKLTARQHLNWDTLPQFNPKTIQRVFSSKAGYRLNEASWLLIQYLLMKHWGSPAKPSQGHHEKSPSPLFPPLPFLLSRPLPSYDMIGHLYPFHPAWQEALKSHLLPTVLIRFIFWQISTVNLRLGWNQVWPIPMTRTLIGRYTPFICTQKVYLSFLWALLLYKHDLSVLFYTILVHEILLPSSVKPKLEA